MSEREREKWLAEPITYRQFLTEQTMLDTDVEWYLAAEAVATLLLAHPEIDGDRLRPRGEWAV